MVRVFKLNISRKASFGICALIPCLTGCSDTEIRTYNVPKEPLFQVAAAHQHGSPTPGAKPHLHWENLPPGWEEIPPDRMRVANFRVTGPEGGLAEVVVIPLPGAADIELESVNLWRGEELGLPPLEQSDLAEARTVVQVGADSGHLYDMTSEVNIGGNDFKTRILGVIVSRPEALWFIKMSGEEALVGKQKSAFIEFLKGLEFHASAHTEMAAAETPVVSANTGRVPPKAGLPAWEIPEHWQERPPGSMVAASFRVTGQEGGQADVSVSKLPGDGGGLLPNINRWRRQLALEPIGPADISTHVAYVAVDSEKVPMVDFNGTDARSGEPARMISVAVPQGGETWFYKFMGDEEVIEQEKDTFLSFIQSAY